MKIGIDDDFIMDQCILDLYIVSNCNRNVILGRPTLYLAVDKETRKVRAFHVSVYGDTKEALNVMLENFPGGVKKTDMNELFQKFSVNFSIALRSINLERKFKDIQRIIDDSDVGTIGNSQQATLTIDELRVIINNWVQNLNSGENNVI